MLLTPVGDIVSAVPVMRSRTNVGRIPPLGRTVVGTFHVRSTDPSHVSSVVAFSPGSNTPFMSRSNQPVTLPEPLQVIPGIVTCPPGVSTNWAGMVTASSSSGSPAPCALSSPRASALNAWPSSESTTAPRRPGGWVESASVNPVNRGVPRLALRLPVVRGNVPPVNADCSALPASP